MPPLRARGDRRFGAVGRPRLRPLARDPVQCRRGR